MSLPRIPVLILSAILIAACSKEAPKSSTTAESNAPRPVAEQEKELAAKLAEQKKELDDRTSKERDSAEKVRRVKLVADLGRSWSAAVNELRAAPRSKLDEPIGKMEALRNQAQSLDVDSCTATSRDTLLKAMNMMIDAAKAFKGQNTGDQTEAVSKAIQESQNLFADSNTQLLPCN